MTKNRRQEKRAAVLVASVTADLDSVRNEERLGGVISQKSDSDLFVIDKFGGESAASKSTDQRPTLKSRISNLKIDQILRPESGYSVPAAHKRKQVASDAALLERKAKALLGAAVSSKSSTADSNNDAAYDPWAGEDESLSKTASKTKPSPAVSTAHSYNPDKEVHLNHLTVLEESESRKIEVRQNLLNSIKQKKTEGTLDCMHEANKRLLLGLPYDNAVGAVSSEATDENSAAGFASSSTQFNRRKTTQDRNRQKRHRESLRVQSALRCQKKLNSSIDRVPNLLAEMKTSQQSQSVLDEMVALQREARAEQKRASRIRRKLVEEPLNVKLPEELPSSMRLLAPEGNLLTDQFRNLVERGIIEPNSQLISKELLKNRRRLHSAQPIFKPIEKYSYKNFK